MRAELTAVIAELRRLREENAEMRKTTIEECAALCDAEQTEMQREAKAGHWSLKDERRLRDVTAGYLAVQIRKLSSAAQKGEQDAG